MNMYALDGKVALITGGVAGIGLCLAKELLRNNVKGVALLDIDSLRGDIVVKELESEFFKNCAIYINTDVTQRSQFEDAFEQTIKTFHQLDIVINNAGIVQELQWEKCIAVNLQGCITGSLLALDKYFPQVLGNSQGMILNISSGFGLIPAPNIPVYSATKHGVIGFSRSIANPSRCRDLNVKTIVACPGYTTTSILQVTKDQIHEEFLINAKNPNEARTFQTPEQLASQLVIIMKTAKTGSVWLIIGDESKEVKYPKDQ